MLITNLLFPEKCVLCGKILDRSELDLCNNCRVDSPECNHHGKKFQFLNTVTALWYYEGNVRRSLLRFKFYGTRAFARSYGRLLAMKASQQIPDGYDLITWVPVSFFRKLKRGYDQVELLGKYVSLKPVWIASKR